MCLCECDREREIDRPPRYIILNSQSVVLGSVEGARVCVCGVGFPLSLQAKQVGFKRAI